MYYTSSAMTLRAAIGLAYMSAILVWLVARLVAMLKKEGRL